MSEFRWKGPRDQIVLSPRDGGRVASWQHGAHGELIKTFRTVDGTPIDSIDGGLLRVMVGEERYPGTSYLVPHLARVLRNDHRGFSVHLRHLWGASNALARLLEWHDKTNPSHFDNLLLDKIVTFDAASTSFLVELSLTNVASEFRYITPWLQSHFHGWVDQAFVVVGGERRAYTWHDVHWAGHRAEPGRSMRLVHASKDGSLAVVLGASTDWLAGMYSYTRDELGDDDATDGLMELRGRPVALPPNHHWRASAFLALSEGSDAWQTSATTSPAPLFTEMTTVPDDHMRLDPRTLLPLLQEWALPDEKRKGLMALSHLDKVPFTSASRYGAANSFSGFHLDAARERASASVILFPLRDFGAVDVRLNCTGEWRISSEPVRLTRYEPYTLEITGPPDLNCKNSVRVDVSSGGQTLASLRVEPDAAEDPSYRVQVKQASQYLEGRWRADKGGFDGTTREQLLQWQSAARLRFLRWVNDSVSGPAPLVPRVVERQTGPRCVREKILIQTEPDLWVPMYLIRPQNASPRRKLPAILFLHGSCPGKMCFAPDETDGMYATGDGWPSTYQLAHELGCIVAVPDLRGWGEWSEANHGQRWQRSHRAGYDITAMAVWDQMRAVDYLSQRPDVDADRIVSMGSSGGGRMTLFLLGADQRVSGGIVSSWAPTPPALPDQYFFQSYPEQNLPTNPPPQLSPQARPFGQAEDEFPINPTPELPLAPSTILALAAPRVLWVMDGRWDRCVLPAGRISKEEAETTFARWHVTADAGRAEIARAYRLLDAERNYTSSWFDGGHLAGFTFNNISGWMRRNFMLQDTT